MSKACCGLVPPKMGVMRYDGRNVTLFEFDAQATNSLSHNDAGNLMLDQHGRIWIGTWGGGANVYHPKNRAI